MFKLVIPSRKVFIAIATTVLIIEFFFMLYLRYMVLSVNHENKKIEAEIVDINKVYSAIFVKYVVLQNQSRVHDLINVYIPKYHEFDYKRIVSIDKLPETISPQKKPN